ncbi:MAG: 2-amino-4-hydroxy-6-hydroxymethyldihydropteridine diphosphokinase [Desulfobacteraceae bacterium]|nr:2-amino-4-hydroxy-6-hydroxymethyldihydropteridine diphosphokinase [Desulfobacteraceae bacterium]
MRAAIGLGSNQGDSVRICREACESLRNDPAVHILGISSFYRTEPVGVAGQDWYVNAVLLCETSLPALELLQLLMRVEQSFGRVRAERWGPRTLDLDILFYGDTVLRLPGLRVPHPRMHERLFVMAPLCEIAPEWIHPELGLSVRELLEQLLRSDHQQQICKLD